MGGTGNDFYQCAKCAARPQLYEQLGHDGPPTFFWTENLIDDTPLERCPIRQLQLARAQLQAEVVAWRETDFPLYEKGHLLVEGGISAQPARWLAAMRFLEDLRGRQDAKYLELTKPPEGA